jgi:hypothetical protein
MALQTTGETFFELPLRGESLGAWLNSLSIGESTTTTALSEDREHLVPERRIFAITIMFR